MMKKILILILSLCTAYGMQKQETLSSILNQQLNAFNISTSIDDLYTSAYHAHEMLYSARARFKKPEDVKAIHATRKKFAETFKKKWESIIRPTFFEVCTRVGISGCLTAPVNALSCFAFHSCFPEHIQSASNTLYKVAYLFTLKNQNLAEH